MNLTINSINFASRFKRNYKKLKKKHYSTDKINKAIHSIIIQNQNELIKLDNHYLHGDLQGFQELHVDNDVLILYYINGSTLYLARIGSHDDLFRNND